MSDRATVENAVQAIYGDARHTFDALRAKFPEAKGGFSILYGRPIIHAPVMFVGFQPGGVEEPDQDTWPAACEYAFETYKLARTLQRIFGQSFLDQCTGLNVVFARAPSKKDYYALPVGFTDVADKYCPEKVRELIGLLRPRRLVAIGVQTTDLLGPLSTDIFVDGRRVIRTGEIMGVPAMAVKHLSGAWLRHRELTRITEELRAFAGLPSLALEGA